MIQFKKSIKTILLVYILVFNQTAFANECEDVVVLEKGQPAPCEGILLSDKAAKAADEAHEDAKYYKELSLKLEERRAYSDSENAILEQRLQLYMTQSTTLATELTKRESSSKIEKIVYFSLGVLATGIAVHAATKIID